MASKIGQGRSVRKECCNAVCVNQVAMKNMRAWFVAGSTSGSSYWPILHTASLLDDRLRSRSPSTSSCCMLPPSYLYCPDLLEHDWLSLASVSMCTAWRGVWQQGRLAYLWSRVHSIIVPLTAAKVKSLRDAKAVMVPGSCIRRLRVIFQAHAHTKCDA